MVGALARWVVAVLMPSALLLSACGGGSSRRLEWRYGLNVEASELQAAIRTGGCDGSGTVYEATFDAAGGGAMAPPALRPGDYGFEIIALDGAGERVGCGCEELTVPSDRSEVVTTVGPDGCDCASGRCVLDGGVLDGGAPDGGTPDGGGDAAAPADGGACSTPLPVGHYRLDEDPPDSQATDSSDDGNHATRLPLRGGAGALSVDGQAGRAYRFQESALYGVASDHLDFPRGFSVSFWTRDGSTGVAVAVREARSLTPRIWSIGYDTQTGAGTVLNVHHQPDRNAPFELAEPDRWHHVAVVWKPDSLRVWLDGGELELGDAALPLEEDQFPIYMFIGGWKRGLELKDQTDGVVDDVQVYGQPLAPCQVARLADGPAL